jgi:hypothetical protein
MNHISVALYANFPTNMSQKLSRLSNEPQMMLFDALSAEYLQHKIFQKFFEDPAPELIF